MSYTDDRISAAAAIADAGVRVVVQRKTDDAYDVVSPSRSVLGGYTSQGETSAVFLPVSKSRLSRFQDGGLPDATVTARMRFALLSTDFVVAVGDRLDVASVPFGTISALTPLDPDASGPLMWYALVTTGTQAPLQGIDNNTIFIDGGDGLMLTDENGSTLIFD